MEKKKRVSTLDLDPLAIRDSRVRGRARLTGTLLIVMVFLGLAAAGVRALMIQSGKGLSFWDPGLAVPVVLLLSAAAAAFCLRRGVRKTYFYVDGEKLYRRPSFWARTAAGATNENVRISDVTSLRLLESPWGNQLVLFGKDEMISVPLYLNGPAFYENLYKELKPALRDKAGDVFLSEPDEKYLMRKLGLWALLSRYNWSLVKGRKPEQDLLLDIWRSDRRLLDYSALLSLLDILLPHLSGCAEFLCDAFRLGLVFRIRPLMEDAPPALKGTGGDMIPLDEWLEVRKGPPRVMPSLPMVGARQYRFDEDKESLLIGVSDVLPLLHVVAICRRKGFSGARILFIYDVWSGKHEISSENAAEPLDDFAVKLMAYAPHVMEIHEERGWSLGSRLRHRRLKNLLQDAVE